MSEVELHARFKTFGYDDDEGPGHLFDPDAAEGASRASERLMRDLGGYSNRVPKADLSIAKSALPEEIERIARNYWQDDDHDYRVKSSQIKKETKRLVACLNETVEQLSASPWYVRRALASGSGRFSSDSELAGHDVYALALRANSALLEAGKHFSTRKHRKSGGAVRFLNASRDLIKLWEQTFGMRFPRNLKLVEAHDREKREGIEKVFENPASRFVFDAIYEMARHWPKLGQVQDALRAVLRENRVRSEN